MPSFLKLSRALPASIALLCLAESAIGFDPVKWAQATKAGSKAVDSGDFGSAERSFKEALQEVKTAPANDIRVAESLTNLGVLYVNRGQSAKAEPLFEKACKIKEASLGPYDKDTIETESKLAQFYLGLGKKDKAQALTDKVVEYGEVESRQFIELSMAFKKLAAYYQTHRKLESAEIAAKQAEEETMGAMKAQAVESAVLLDALGSAIKDIGTERALKQAEKLFKSSLALRERTLSAEHAAVASSLENLGRLYLAQGRTAQAEPLLKRSYEISLSTLGPDRRETQLRLDGLAQSYAAGGHYSEAEALYKKVLDASGKDKAKAQTAIADIACNLAAMLVKQGRYSEALPYYARALKIQEGANGPQHASLANLLDSYAYALGKANRGAEAKKYQARARSIRG